MPTSRPFPYLRPAFAAVVACGVSLSAHAAPPYEPPVADTAPTTKALKKLPRKQGERVAVSIYEFRSALPTISSTAATDMFKTALVQSGQFNVVERSRLNEGVAREKQLNQAGFTTGSVGRTQLRGAQYLFEGVVSEANSSESQRSGTVGIAGMQVGGGGNEDSVAVDVRVVDAGTGDIVDAITVRKAVQSDTAGVSGVGNLIGAVLAQRGKPTTFVPDVNVQQQRREGIDSALRAAINQAVAELSQRFAP